MRRALVFALLAGAAFAAVDRPRVKRAAIEAMQRLCDQRIVRLVEDPLLLLGNTHGVYLEGYGAVFTAEMNLFLGPTISPFRQSISEADIARVRQKKLERLPALRQCMREVLMESAASLDEVPADEKIALNVTLLSLGYENKAGLPGQILMQAQKSKLIEAKLGRVPVESVIRVQEY
jgi:hypothetical protein